MDFSQIRQAFRALSQFTYNKQLIMNYSSAERCPQCVKIEGASAQSD